MPDLPLNMPAAAKSNILQEDKPSLRANYSQSDLLCDSLQVRGGPSTSVSAADDPQRSSNM